MQKENHFGVIYLFDVKPDRIDQFVKTWKEFTNLIIEEENSLGSRLHRINATQYFAYAYWPNKNHFEGAGNNGESLAMQEIRHNQEKNIVNVTRIAEGEVIENLIQSDLNKPLSVQCL